MYSVKCNLKIEYKVYNLHILFLDFLDELVEGQSPCLLEQFNQDADLYLEAQEENDHSLRSLMKSQPIFLREAIFRATILLFLTSNFREPQLSMRGVLQRTSEV